MAYCLYVIKKENISIFKLKATDSITPIISFIKPIDWFVFFFLVLNLVWATIVPILVRKNITYALNDVSTITIFALYFPIIFLHRTGRFDFKKLLNLSYYLILLLALWHTTMYVGETLHPGFYSGYYDFIDLISFGTAVRTTVVYGFGVVRIIQTTSIFLIPAIFIAVKRIINKFSIRTVLEFALVLFSILITYTKSIWFGVFAGLIVLFITSILFSKKKTIKLNTLASLGTFISLFLIFNFCFLNNTIISRINNTVDSDASLEIEQQILEMESLLNSPDNDEALEKLEELKSQYKDSLGTLEANQFRSIQNKALFKKWNESKLIGHGYGAYTEECIRNDQFPYMYESLLPSLFMKLGIWGLLIWGVFVVSLLIFAIKRFWKNKKDDLFLWISIALSFAMAVQTNPLLFTFTGISLLLFLVLYIECMSEKVDEQ